MDRSYQPLSLADLPIEANVSLLAQTQDIESLINLFKVNPVKYGPMLNNPVNLLPLIELYGLNPLIKTFGELVNAYDIKYGTKSCLKHKSVFHCSEAAARWGDLRTIEYILNANPLNKHYRANWILYAIGPAAEGGHIKIVDKLYRELAGEEEISQAVFDIITHAIAGGNDWIVDIYKHLVDPSLLKLKLLYGYALKGDLDNFTRLYPTVRIVSGFDVADLNSHVGQGGNISILDYLVSQGRAIQYNSVFNGAANGLRLNFILEIEKRGINVDSALLAIAAKSNDVLLAGEAIARLGESLSPGAFSVEIMMGITKAAFADSVDVFKLLASFIHNKDEAENKSFRTKWIKNAILGSPNLLRYLLTWFHLPKDKEILHTVLGKAIVEYDDINSVDIILGVDEQLLDEAFLIATAPGVSPKVASHISNLYNNRNRSRSPFMSQPYQPHQPYQPY